MTNDILVVGGGLAGLAAAYELRNEPGARITVLEQNERIGGRVHCLPVRGRMVDMGGFILFPWYREFRRIARELGVSDTIRPMRGRRNYYQMDDTGVFYPESALPIPRRDTAALARHMIGALVRSQDPAEPALDAFGRKTVSECFRAALRRPAHAGIYETYVDTAAQGYCYPPATEYKMAFMAAFIRIDKLIGSSRTSIYPEGNWRLTNGMAEAIRACGHAIKTGVRVRACRGNSLETDAGDFRADRIVFAQNADETLYRSILPDAPSAPRYTSYHTLVLEMDRVPPIENSVHWQGLFFKPNHDAFQVTSAMNLGSIYDSTLDGCVTVNVVVRDATATEQTPEEVLARVLPTLAVPFQGARATGILASARWERTMPNASEDFVQFVRARQGHGGYYFAGDWLGAPSMETAIRTGVRAAHAIRKDLASGKA